MPTAPKTRRTALRRPARRAATPEPARPRKVVDVGALTGKQRRALRALGHHLKPVVQVGHEDVTPGVVEAIDAQLLAHELIKIKIGEGAQTPRKELAQALAEQTESGLVQVLGRTVLLYRPHPEKPKIEV